MKVMKEGNGAQMPGWVSWAWNPQSVSQDIPSKHSQIPDEQTYEPVEYLCKLPKTKNKKIIVLDPMLATGNSSIAAINLILNKGVGVNNIFLVSLLAAPEGLKNIQKTHKKLRIFTCQIDKKLNKNKFIVPGLGDAGDRYMGT